MGVALFARAWIEITNSIVDYFVPFVALFARAWIEIRLWVLALHRLLVALFARAWIEIRYVIIDDGSLRSSPSLRGRGLK